jgi:hypothetical protein
MTIVTVTIPRAIAFATPALTLATANAQGAAATAIRSDAELLVYDATVPTTIAASASAATGSAAQAARRDHVHGSAAAYTTFAAPSFTLGVSNITGSGDSVHAGATLLAFDTTVPSSAGIADQAAVGSATVASRRDHLHGDLVAFALTRLYGH